MTTYTIEQLKKSNTDRIISIYSRVTGRSAWETYFNPYTERDTMIVVILSYNPKSEIEQGVARRHPVQIHFTADGIVVVWVNEVIANVRKLSAETIRLIHSLRTDGETVASIAQWFGLSNAFVSKIARGLVYADIV